MILNFLANQIEAKYFQLLRLKDRFLGGMRKDTRENHSHNRNQTTHKQCRKSNWVLLAPPLLVEVLAIIKRCYSSHLQEFFKFRKNKTNLKLNNNIPKI